MPLYAHLDIYVCILQISTYTFPVKLSSKQHDSRGKKSYRDLQQYAEGSYNNKSCQKKTLKNCEGKEREDKEQLGKKT